MVIKISRKREGTTNLASNQITAQLGNTLNGTQPVNGVAPEEMKKQIDLMSDMQAQSNVSNRPAEVGTEPASGPSSILNPQGQLGQALQGQNGEVDLSKVPQDQKDFLLQNMMALVGATPQK